jgi:putative MATE family efflux protein
MYDGYLTHSYLDHPAIIVGVGDMLGRSAGTVVQEREEERQAATVAEHGPGLARRLTNSSPVRALGAAARVVGVPGAAPDAASATLLRSVWALALPAIGEQVLALGVGLSDTFLSGHLSAAAERQLGYGRADAVAAIGAASTIVWVILTAFFAINVGITALVARATGARDQALARRTAGQGVVLGAAAGLLVAALAAPLAEVVAGLIGLSGHIAVLAAGYIRILSLALPATGIASAANAAMRGAGDTRRPMLVMLAVNGANILGSWLLLNGMPQFGIPAIGVYGSALGAAAGWALGAVVAVAFLRRDHSRAPKLVRAALRPHGETILRILRVGLPSTAELMIFQLGVVMFVRFVVGLGPSDYAAYVAINSVESIGTLPAFGFAVAATSLVGQALGAGDPDLAARSTWATLRPCLAVVAAISLCALLVPQLVLGLFVADPAVLAAGSFAMRMSVLTIPASAAAFVFNGALRGAGDTKFPVVVRASGTWGLRVPLALLLIPIFALFGARLVMALDYSAQASLAYWRFRGGRWRRARV